MLFAVRGFPDGQQQVEVLCYCFHGVRSHVPGNGRIRLTLVKDLERIVRTGACVLEVCVASVSDALEAVAGGADRLELNSALELGGLTPSVGMLIEVRQAVSVPVIVMIRPRGAGFCYSASEHRVMLRDADKLLEQGADGIALGAFAGIGEIDPAVSQQFVTLAGARTTVFHRAFDLLSDPRRALDQLSELGFTRVMTSGQAASALAGAELIASLQREYGHRIEILPAAGIGPENAGQLLRKTGCQQLHGSFRKYLSDGAGPVAESRYGVTDRELVAATRRAVDSCRSGED